MARAPKLLLVASAGEFATLTEVVLVMLMGSLKREALWLTWAGRARGGG